LWLIFLDVLILFSYIQLIPKQVLIIQRKETLITALSKLIKVLALSALILAAAGANAATYVYVKERRANR
jgi:hypothetical protein